MNDSERIEAEAIRAAEREHAMDLDLFLNHGKYPGWCAGAADGTCPHEVKHVVSPR